MAFTETVNFYLKTDNDFYIKYELEMTLAPTFRNLKESVKEAIGLTWNDITGVYGDRIIKHRHKTQEKIYITHTYYEEYKFKYKNLREIIKEEKKELLKELGCETIEIISEEEYKAAVE